MSEALQNAARHAKADQAQVVVEVRAGRLRLRISDDGIGGADPREGTGLRGLADRVAAVAGILHVASPPGQGTVVTADIPWT